MKKILLILLLFIFFFQSLPLASIKIQNKDNKLVLIKEYSHTITDKNRVIKDWHITRDGIKISEIEFLYVIGENERAKEIEDDISRRNLILKMNTVLAMTGILVYVASYGKSTIGLLGFLVGGAIGYAINPPRHYLEYREVDRKIKQYNKNLRNT